MRSMIHRLALALALLVLPTGCATDPTQVSIVVDSDLDVPGDLDALVIEVTSPSGAMQSATADLETQSLPASLTVVTREAGEHVARISGRRGNGNVVVTTARFTPEPNRARQVSVTLYEACIDVSCNAATESTCGEGGVCGGSRVSLRPLRALPSADAGL